MYEVSLMKILVLIKEVPDMDKVKFDSQRGVVDRAKAPAEINPFDENALEIAVELKEKYPDSYVSVLTMGPKRAEKSLRMAYARGAEGILNGGLLFQSGKRNYLQGQYSAVYTRV